MAVGRSIDTTRAVRTAERAAGRRDDHGIAERLALAQEHTGEALSQIQWIAIEEIRDGLETSNHVEAADRDMRSALRQLVLAERDFYSRSLLRTCVDRHPEVIGSSASGHDSQGAAAGLAARHAALRELIQPKDIDD